MFTYKVNDRVKVIDPEYCCAEVGVIGTILEEFNTVTGGKRYRVRWDGSSNLYNVRPECIDLVMRKL